MVSALDATADKTKQVEAIQAQLKQAEDRALLYEVMKLICYLLTCMRQCTDRLPGEVLVGQSAAYWHA